MRRCDRTKDAAHLLPRGVPDLHGVGVTFDDQILVEEFHPNGMKRLCVKFVVHEAVHQTGLADTAIAKDHHL